jgi:hypothetical protein
MQKLKIFTFDDLEFKPHGVVPGAVHAVLELPNGTSVSVVGGGSGRLHGDGVNAFECWYSDEDDPRVWQSTFQINEELRERSIRLLGLL